jgi:hypothetical protein
VPAPAGRLQDFMKSRHGALRRHLRRSVLVGAVKGSLRTGADATACRAAFVLAGTEPLSGVCASADTGTLGCR